MVGVTLRRHFAPRKEPSMSSDYETGYRGVLVVRIGSRCSGRTFLGTTLTELYYTFRCVIWHGLCFSLSFRIIELGMMVIFRILISPLRAELNPICKSQLAELFCRVFKFCTCFSKNLSVYTQIWHRTPFMIDSVLRHCADNKKRGLSMLPNVGHQIVHIKIAGITRRSPYSLR